MSLTGIPISPLAPGSPAWYRKMSASKVAAVMGLSPYDSRFSLYHRMNGTVDPDAQTDEQSRGHYLEPAVCQWFADQHPEFEVLNGGCWQHHTLDWYTASPDRLLAPAAGPDREIEAGFDAKTATDDDGYGTPGTDEVPVHIRAQTMSQMDVVGTRRTYVAVLSAYLEFREYVIDFDQAEADFIRSECAQFMDDIANGVRPNLDEHTATYQTLRKLSPGIEDFDVELPVDVVRAYCEAKQGVKVAEAEAQRMTSVIADLLGNGRRARFLGQTIATRQSRKDGTPYVVVARSLPTFDKQETSAA